MDVLCTLESELQSNVLIRIDHGHARLDRSACSRWQAVMLSGSPFPRLHMKTRECLLDLFGTIWCNGGET